MRLIDVDEVKKRYPIMENDFGMVVNERLHKELDKIPTIEAVPLSVIDEIKAEIADLSKAHCIHLMDREDIPQLSLDIISEKVKEYEK